MNRNLKYLSVGVLSVLFSLFVIELGLQFVDKPKRPVSGWDLIGASKKRNYLGFRGREIVYSPDDYVVLLIGDSLVTALAVPFNKMPEQQLEHYLKVHKENVKVFTLGSGGHGQDQQLLVLKEYYKKHRADSVVLHFSSQTDVNDNVFPSMGFNETIKPTFWLENGELRGPTEGWKEPLGSWSKLALLWNRYAGEWEGDIRLEKWKKEILPTPYQGLSQYDGEVDYSWQEEKEEYPETAYQRLEFEREGPSNQFTPRSDLHKYGIDLTRKLFSEIKKLVETHNGQFFIFKEERPWQIRDKEREKAYFLDGKYYRASMKQYHDNMRELFEGFNHYRIPLNMERVTPNEEDSHLSRDAIDELMKEVALIVSKQSYFKTPVHE